MDGASGRPSLKERLGLKRLTLTCCSPTLGHGGTTTDDDPPPLCPDQSEVVENPTPIPPSVTLVEAMAAERQWRASRECEMGVRPVSLERVLQESDRDIHIEEESLGSALIPCGHTFCRECSRDLWFNRSFCPLCNRFIDNILDLY
ncbi:hypothetical protein SASPL_121216 [Salvia splendens]|uniref:RING-type domain-containing protein n=1 Tax=Salvia splendens TaxID=180675 RepID=A0A8X8ZW02_SALSN|nr:uncharacterized protein LOC121810702 [Salvia splendens]KAG6419008.1 hypothetical protein SASPL_121216 [Salvia splendens]